VSNATLESSRTNWRSVVLTGGLIVVLLAAVLFGVLQFLHKGSGRDRASAADCGAAQSILDQTRTTPVGAAALPYGRQLEAQANQIKNGVLSANVGSYAVRKSLIAAGQAKAPDSKVMKGTRENINDFCDPALDVPTLS
jgi:hypothetical protein